MFYSIISLNHHSFLEVSSSFNSLLHKKVKQAVSFLYEKNLCKWTFARMHREEY